MSPSKKSNRPRAAAFNGSKVQTSPKAFRKKKKAETTTKNTTEVNAPPAPLPPSKPAASTTTNLLRALALLAVIGITVYIYSIRSRVEEFEKFGYAGIFLIAMMANATVLLPAPGVAIIYAMGAIFNPLGVGLAAGTGGTLGELSGYLAGFSGQAIIEKTHLYERLHPWVEKYGGWTVFVLAAIPNPLFDVAGIAAGIVKMPVQTFLVFTWAGQVIKMLFFAMAGYYSLEWLIHFMQ